MTKFRNYFIIFASVFAITAACALVGMKDVKAAEPALSDLIKRIEALESKPSGGNVVAPKINGLKMGFSIRHRFEFRSNPKSANEDIDFTLQRTRIYLDADVNRNVRGYVKLQDVRTWGAEGSSTGNLARVDMLEGFVELRNLGDFSSLFKDVGVRVG
ncbi:MAG: alginate export family protein, partial [Planctomycetota bacterium]